MMPLSRDGYILCSVLAAPTADVKAHGFLQFSLASDETTLAASGVDTFCRYEVTFLSSEFNFVHRCAGDVSFPCF